MRVDFVDWKKEFGEICSRGRDLSINRYWKGKLIYLNAWRFSLIIDLRDMDKWYEEITGEKPKFIAKQETKQ